MRPVTGVIGSVRFSETLGTFQLSGSDGTEIVRPQETLQSALKKLFLFDPTKLPKQLRSGFNIPFNTMFIPSEYASINCCPECFIPGSPRCPPCLPPLPPPPFLSAITPDHAAANAGTVFVTLEGVFNDTTEFVNISGAGVTAANPAPVDAFGDATTTFTIDPTAVAGTVSVSVTDSGGTSGAVNFTIVPALTSVSPSQGLVGEALSVNINGAGFAPGATVSAGPNIAVSSVAVISSGRIAATFTPVNSTTAGGNQSVTVTVNGQASNSQPFFDQYPANLLVTSTNILPSGTDPTIDGCNLGAGTDFGIEIGVSYQVLDQRGAPINSTFMEPQEKITNACINGSCAPPDIAFSDIGPSRIIGTSQFTGLNGQFLDAPVGICQPASFTGTITQQIQMIVNAVGYSVKTNNYSVSGSSSGHGTISNGLDISAQR